MRITATAVRCDGWWAIETVDVPGLYTQARRLDQVEAMVKDAASMLLGRPEEDFTVVVVPKLPIAERRRIDDARAARARLSDAESAMAKASRAVVADLRAQGLIVRDVATLIGVTPSRVSQLA